VFQIPENILMLWNKALSAPKNDKKNKVLYSRSTQASNFSIAKIFNEL